MKVRALIDLQPASTGWKPRNTAAACAGVANKQPTQYRTRKARGANGARPCTSPLNLQPRNRESYASESVLLWFETSSRKSLAKRQGQSERPPPRRRWTILHGEAHAEDGAKPEFLSDGDLGALEDEHSTALPGGSVQVVLPAEGHSKEQTLP